MIKKFTGYAAFFMALLFCACNQSSARGTQLWFYTYNTSGNLGNDSMLTPASFLYLQKDGSYTRDFGTFDWGHWAQKDNQLVLTDSQNTSTTLPVQSESLREMKLKIGPDVASFEKQPSSFASNQNNPFSLDNNQWRIHSKEKETEQQIRKRLQNHCRFWEAYFTWALDNELSVVDVRSTPTPIKIYGNGFGLKPYHDLPEAWRSCSYDSSDCQQANNIIRDIFEHRNIAWAHTDNKYKMFIAAFQQMERFVK